MYNVGNLIFEVINAQPQMLQALKLFQTSNANIETKYKIEYVDSFSDFSRESIIYNNEYLHVYKIEGGYRYCYIINNKLDVIVEELENLTTIYFNKNMLNIKFHKDFLPGLFLLERQLIHKECFGLHSSNISYKDQSILFTAPSGGGKSTQADLWMKYKKAIILNGDRNFVGKEGNYWYSYGTPFSGSSKYCINHTTPLKAIIILEKSLENKLIRVDLKGFSKVYSQVTISPWDKEFCNKMMDLIMKVCTEVPIYVYSCTKEQDAVEFLYANLVKDGVINE